MMNQIFHSAVTIMIPLMFAAAGGLFTELSGMLNIALEGLLLTGAFSAVTAAHFSGSIAPGIAAAVVFPSLLAAVLALVTLRLKANVFITGLAVNLFAAAFTVVMSFRLFGTRGVVRFPELPDLPVLFGCTYYAYAALAVLFLSWVLLYRTPFGFALRACERDSAALRSLGLRPDRYRFAAFVLSGALCGAGGSFLSLNLGAFVPNMASGKGWTALVVIFLGNRKPPGILAAAFVFGLAEAFSNYAQGAFPIPADFILAIPSVFTLAVMVAVSAIGKRKAAVDPFRAAH